MKAMLIAVLCALPLLGCFGDTEPDMAPIVSGEVINPGVSRLSLSPDQLAGCIEWLKTYRRDWGTLRARPPSPVQSVAFSHSDGARTYLEFYTGRPGWNGKMLIRSYTKDGTLKFTGFGEFSESETAMLRLNLPGQ